MREESHCGFAPNQEREISRELNHITRTLFRINGDAATGDFFTPPQRRLYVRSLTGKVFRFPPPFIVIPSCGEAARKQVAGRAIEQSLGVFWLDGDRLAELRQHLVQLPKCSVPMGLSRSIATDARQFDQRAVSFSKDFGQILLEDQCRIEVIHGLIEPLHLYECTSTIGQGLEVVWTDCQGL